MRPKCNRRRPRNRPDSTEADTYNLFKEFTMEPLWRSSHTVFTRALDAAAARHARDDARHQRESYDFHHPSVLRAVPPPTVAYARPLRWWSLDRPQRLSAALRLRDQLLEDVMRASPSGRRHAAATPLAEEDKLKGRRAGNERSIGHVPAY